MADEDYRLQTARNHLVGKILDLVDRARRLTCQRCPSHIFSGALLRFFGKAIKRAVLASNSTGNLAVDQSLE